MTRERIPITADDRRRIHAVCVASGTLRKLGERPIAPCVHRGPRLETIPAKWLDCRCGRVDLYGCSLYRESVTRLSIAPAGAEQLRLLDEDGVRGRPPYKGRTCQGCKQSSRAIDERAPNAVAVVVTSHNYGRYLRQCLDSILAQTFQPASIVVVDDASEDNTPEVCRAYGDKIRYLRGEWRDASLARNAGADVSPKVSHYLFVDADNWLPANYISVLLGGMTEDTIGVTYCHIDNHDDSGRSLGRCSAVKPFSLTSLRRQNLADTCSLVRRQAFEHVHGWKSNRWGLHDWDLWLRITANGWGMKLVEGTALGYRQHPGAMSDIRRGKPKCGAYVLGHSTLTTAVTLFSGRDWMLDRWFAMLAAVRWTKENLHLVAVDNSGNAAFSTKLHTRLASSGLRHTYVAESARAVVDVPSHTAADSGEVRTRNTYALGQHMARLYSLAARYVPAATANIWSLEDDVECAPDALEQLATVLYHRADASAVSGVMRSRFDRRLIAWLGGSSVKEPPVGTIQVDATGFYCLLIRRDAWDLIAWRPGLTGTERYPYYDWAACADMRKVGKIYLAGAVKCNHWQTNGTCLEV